MDMSVLNHFLEELFERYKQNVVEVDKITQAMIERKVIDAQDDIVNDHIAFRTLGIKHLGISSFEKIFLEHGYSKEDYYNFEEKKLNAYWYKPPSTQFPRVFISELRVQDLSDQSQKIIHQYTKEINVDPIDEIDLHSGEEVSSFLHTPLWATPTMKEYKKLLEESEYAAWVIYNRYYLNHYTISIHELKDGYNTLEDFNAFLKEIGVKLNDSGGEIKVSADGLLRQSSSVSKMKTAKFSCGNELEIAGSYVEFAERGILPQYKNLNKEEIKAIHRREGFAAKNADKIFESTYTSQTTKKDK